MKLCNLKRYSLVVLFIGLSVANANDLATFEANVQKRLNDNYRGYETPFTGIYSLAWPDDNHARTPVLADLDLTMLANSYGDNWTYFDKTKKPVEADKVQAIRARAVADLPWDSALIFRKGDAPVSMAVYSAVDCGYCRRLEAFLETQPFSYAVFPSSLTLENFGIARSVWCHAEPMKAWKNLMLGRADLPAVNSCESYPMTDIRYTGALFVYGNTPGIIFADGYTFGQVPEGEAMIAEFRKELQAKIDKGIVFDVPE